MIESFQSIEKKHSGQMLTIRSGTEPPSGEAQTMFYKAFEVANGDIGRLEPSWRTIQVTVYAEIGDQRKAEAAAVLERRRQSQ